MAESERPQRKHLPHNLPSWVDLHGAVFYLTLCCKDRDTNALCARGVHTAICESIENRAARGVWYPYLVLLMPDHLHMLVSFPVAGKRMGAVVGEWKGWVRKATGVQWQRGFFEHRLRSDESRKDKADYILLNPARAGLVSRAEDWPYVWFPDR